MDSLTRSALIGTTKAPPVLGADDLPVEHLIGSLTELSSEEQLLIRAGVRSISNLAGVQPQPVPALESPPPTEAPPASERLTELLQAALSPNLQPLLREFLQLMQDADIAFPDRLLPQALDLQNPQQRQWLRPILGPRAHWLAQFHSGWSWVLNADRSTDDIPRLTKQWEEGTFAQRVQALAEIRTIDADLGRAWLKECFPTEKGEHRRKLLEQMRPGLSLADEPFLVEQMNDRSQKVRSLVCELLSLIPGSSLSQRLCTRSLEVLKMTVTPAGARRLTCHSPEEFPTEWKKDGIQETAPSGIGRRSWWIHQLLRRIPPGYWCDEFESSPSDLLKSLSDRDAALVRDSWIEAAIAFHERDTRTNAWLGPLWENLTNDLRHQIPTSAHLDRLEQLAEAMDSESLDRGLIILIRATPELPAHLFTNLAAKHSSTWSRELSECYLQTTRRLFQSRADAPSATWAQTLLSAAIGMSPDCFEQALQSWSIAADRQGVWQSVQLEQRLIRFGEIIRTRHAFREEICSSRNRE